MSASPTSATPAETAVDFAAQPPRLVDQVAASARTREASEPTTEQLVSWVRAYVLFQGRRHRGSWVCRRCHLIIRDELRRKVVRHGVAAGYDQNSVEPLGHSGFFFSSEKES